MDWWLGCFWGWGEPHNAFVKAFASRPAQKAKALATIRQQTDLSDELLGYFEVLRTLWSLPEGAVMNELLTPRTGIRDWAGVETDFTSTCNCC